MLKKRDLPVCVEIPGIRIDVEKVKEEIKKIEHMWQDIYAANPGITNLHHSDFVDNAYINLREIPLMVLPPEQMKSADDFTKDDLGKDLKERIRNKKAKGANLPPAANEMLWDYKTEACIGNYFDEFLSTTFKSQVCRARLHKLGPGLHLAPHIDYDPSYGVRIVCPISGTEGTVNQFWVNGEYQEYSLPADGRVYFLNTGFKHGVVNNGTEPRIALLATLKTQEDIECLALK